MNDKYNRAAAYLKNILNADDKHYEIVEDSYEYDNGLLLIVYEDAAHEIEKYHVCINVDEF